MPKGKGKGARSAGGGGAKTGVAATAKWQTILAKQKEKHDKHVAELTKQPELAKNEKGEGGSTGTTIDDVEGGANKEELEKTRRKRECLRKEWEEDDPTVQALDARIWELVLQRDQAKPHRVRLSILDRNIAKC